MNPLTNMKNVIKLSEQELKNAGGKTTWHDMYRDSAWIFVGGLPYNLTEGDIMCVFSQYGEIATMNLVRDKDTGKSKGFCFVCYEDQRSTILAVDNLNGIKILNRSLRVDHVADYKPPKNDEGALHNYLQENGAGSGGSGGGGGTTTKPDVKPLIKREHVKREKGIKAESDSESDDSAKRRRRRR